MTRLTEPGSKQSPLPPPPTVSESWDREVVRRDRPYGLGIMAIAFIPLMVSALYLVWLISEDRGPRAEYFSWMFVPVLVLLLPPALIALVLLVHRVMDLGRSIESRARR